MPEMLQFCGKRFRISKSAHKACDTIFKNRLRRMDHAYHLEGLRCDGAAHGGCQAGCLLYWKSAWLKPAGGARAAGEPTPTASDNAGLVRGIDALRNHTLAWTDEAVGAEYRYRCQATELVDATQPLEWWGPRQYLKDVRSGNFKLSTVLYFAARAFFNIVWRRITRDPDYPYVPGTAQGRVEGKPLNLRPGELVRVKPREEIMRTLDRKRRNLGLSFDVEMEPFCGKTFRVLRRVEKLINEQTGMMIHVKRDCIVLESVVCGGCRSRNRMFCPRAIFPYWREIWLERVE
jgi:hypothetical protein